jgi:hypothetical protein
MSNRGHLKPTINPSILNICREVEKLTYSNPLLHLETAFKVMINFRDKCASEGDSCFDRKTASTQICSFILLIHGEICHLVPAPYLWVDWII